MTTFKKIIFTISLFVAFFLVGSANFTHAASANTPAITNVCAGDNGCPVFTQ